ncbi:MAG: hypothetical protein JO110_03695 [Acetobacteraceae bacterium]|nr:hypothetical protein [Acetobacteraceae bacterium]
MALIIAGLRGLLAAHMAKDRSAVEVLFLAWARLGRLASRFEKLVEAVRAGRLPPAPAPRGEGAGLELPRLEGLPPPRLPGCFGWLIRLVPGSAVYGSQLQYLLADPEMAALLASAPQAGRILRPLCRMLAIPLGPELGATRRGRSVLPADRVGLGDTAVPAAAGPVHAPRRAIPPASPAESRPAPPLGSGFASPVGAGAVPGSQFASTGSHFAAQDGGPGLGSRP